MACHAPTLFVRCALGALLAIACATGASAQGSATKLTFDRAVRVPGVTLPAGTYVFEHTASDNDRRTVQVYRTNPRRLVATLMAHLTTRDGGGADVVFDGPRRALPALRAWYEPGTQDGYSLIYTQTERERIAQPGAALSTR